jgi:uncharacterized protein
VTPWLTFGTTSGKTAVRRLAGPLVFALSLGGLGGLGGCDSCSQRHVDATVTVDAGAPARSPAEIRREGNHLTDQSSLYLREHAKNPVDWYPWTAETLARAKALDRPIFLSIGYASCHWCHVMAAEVFESDDVAALLNEHFVSIKVDREERPDVDATYMDVVQSMTGSGGWPASIFLTPQLQPFFAGTYFPKERFLDVIRSAAKQFKESRTAVEQRGAEVHDRIASAQASSARGDRVRVGEIKAIAERSLASVDEAWGGFKGQMKFPSPSRWMFLLHAARKWDPPRPHDKGDTPYPAAVRRTLDMMASGGLFDQVGGGFFRYSVEPTWTVPHFEKMLYVNASLARLYLEAYGAFGEAKDLAIARRTLDFLLHDMRSADGGFFASLDADSDGKEGAFYVFSGAEIRGLFGAEAPAVAKLFGVTDAGNFDGKNVLTLRGPESARPDARSLDAIRAKLADAREKRVHPTRDEKIVTAWNGLAIEAFARGFTATGEARYLEAATRAAEHLWRAHRPDGRLARTSTAGKTGGDGVLDDYAAYASALVTLFQATSNPSWLERAVELVTEVQKDFAHPDGGFFSTRAGGPLDRRVELFDNEEPCGVSVMLSTLLGLAALTGRPALYDAIDRALAANAPTARRAGLGMASWLDAALLEAGPFYDVVIAGPPGAASTVALRNAWQTLSPPWAVRTDVDAAGASAALLAVLPPLEGKVARGTTAVAYVCVRGACSEPTSDSDKLRAQLRVGWTR